MTLAPHEFIRRFLLHVLPHGFHRIRHYGLLASSARKTRIARARELLAVAPPPEPVEVPEPLDWLPPCPCCGGRMARATRLAPTLSLLRRAHDHHRDLRAMAATTGATARARTKREQHVVTRHGLRSPHAATPKLGRMPQGAPFATIGATGLDMTRGQFPMNGLPGEKSHSPSPRQPQRQAGSGMTSTKQNSKSP